MPGLLDLLWLFGAVLSVAFLLYGAWVYCCYRCAQASSRVVRFVARLGMYESARIGQSMDELREEVTEEEVA